MIVVLLLVLAAMSPKNDPAQAAAVAAIARLFPAPANVRVVIDKTAKNPYIDNDGVIRTPRKLGRYERAHEIGHVFDQTALTDADRARFTRIMKGPVAWSSGVPAANGVAAQPMTQATTGAGEFFADYYAYAVLGLDPRPKTGKNGVVTGKSYASYVTPRPRRLRRFKRYLEQVGQQHPDLKPY